MNITEIISRLKQTHYETEEEYRQDLTAISSHFLMSFSSNKIEKKDEFAYKPYFSQGHLLEDLIFSENYDNYLKEKYLIQDWTPNETQQKLIAHYVGSNFPHTLKSEEEIDNKILEIIKENKLWAAVKDITKIRNRYDIKEFWEYLNNIFSEVPKYILSTEQYQVIQSAADRVRELPIIKRIREGDDNLFYMIHPMYKVEVQWGEYIFDAKAQIDLLVVDKKNKEVKIFDFKTTSDTAGDFGIAYRKYKYYFQSLLYRYIIEEIIAKTNIIYPVKFYFIVVSKTHEEETPLIIKDDAHVLSINYSKIFNNLGYLIFKKKISIKEIIQSPNSPIALLRDFEPNMRDLII